MRSWSWDFDPGVWLGDDAEGISWIDIETRKLTVPDESRFPYRRRWQPFMIGLAGLDHVGAFRVEVFASDDESELIDHLLESTEGTTTIRYQATRDFDQMVLRGRFTHARAGLLPEPLGEWPVFDPPHVSWENQRKIARPLPPLLTRPSDVPSEHVPVAWERGGRDLVALHCARDVALDVLTDPTIPVIGELLDWLVGPSPMRSVERTGARL